MGVPVLEEAAKSLPTPAQPPRRRLRRCCCGCSLTTGCVVIGTFSVLNGISTLYVGLVGLGVSSSSIALEDNLTANVISIFYGALHLVTGLSLIYGVDKRKISLLKFWLYSRYVELALIIGAALYILILSMSHSISAAPIFVIIFSFIVGIGVVSYCIAIVQSFCQEITDDIQRLNEYV